MLNVQGAMDSPGQILNAFPDPARLCRRIIVRYFEYDRGKRDYAIPISRQDHDEFYTGLGLTKSNNHTSSLALLICDFSLLIPIPSMEFGLLIL
jgi:hypothetical protein